MNEQSKQVRPFGVADKIGYAFGDFGNDFTFIFSAMMLMKFYTDVMGVSAGLVGLLMMLARFVDAFTDVTMGQITDRSKRTAKGKFAPWILRMMGPVAVASFLIYATWFKDMSMGFKVFWMFFTYLLWGSVCYTGINIPYGSMASAITDKPEERGALSTWRTIGATLAGTFIGVIVPQIVYYRDANGNSALNADKMMVVSLICSIGAIVCYLLCYFLCTERVIVEPKNEKFELGKLLKSLVTNKSLIGIVVGALLLLLAQLSLSGMASYIYPNYFNNGQAQSAGSLIQTIVTLGMATFATKLCAKIGKKEFSMITALIGAAALLIAFVMHTTSVTVWYVLYAFGYVGVAGFTLVCWAMITDVIDDTEIKEGSRSDGTIYSVYSFARKMGQAASSGLTGLLLTLIGYSSATAFDPSVTNGIYNITCLAPAIGFILMAAALKFLYPLDKKTVDANAEILRQKKDNK